LAEEEYHVSMKEALEKLADRISERTNYETSSKVNRALDVVCIAIHDVIADLPDTPAPATIVRAENIEKFEAGRKHERDRVADELSELRAAVVKLTTERDVWKQTALNEKTASGETERLLHAMRTERDALAARLAQRQHPSTKKLADDLEECMRAAEALKARAEKAEGELAALKPEGPVKWP
jgi:hypothetical protein